MYRFSRFAMPFGSEPALLRTITVSTAGGVTHTQLAVILQQLAELWRGAEIEGEMGRIMLDQSSMRSCATQHTCQLIPSRAEGGQVGKFAPANWDGACQQWPKVRPPATWR